METGAKMVEPTQLPTAKPIRAAVRLREAAFSDYQQIVDLQLRNGLTTRPYADWVALWSENPAYLRSKRHIPIGWVVEKDDETVAGFLGNLLLSYTFRGRDLTAATAHSWVVDQAFRGYSVLLLDTFRKQTGVDMLVFTTVNAAAEAVLRGFGMHKVPAGEWDMARFWITDHQGFVSAVLPGRALPFARFFSAPVAAALWARDTVLSLFEAAVLRTAPEITLEVQSEFDGSFESFWSETRRLRSNRLLAVRDQETLAWHYRSSSREGTVWIVTANLHGRMVAYWVVDRWDHPSLGLKRLRFVDFQSLPGYENLLTSAIEWTLQHARNHDVHVVEDSGSWLKTHKVPGTVGPYKRRMKSWLFYYWARDPELAEQLRNPDIWTASSFDGDASL